MASRVYISVWLYQEGEYTSGHVRLTNAHADDSKEELIFPIQITPQNSILDVESWAREALAEVIERM